MIGLQYGGSSEIGWLGSWSKLHIIWVILFSGRGGCVGSNDILGFNLEREI